MRSAVVLSQVQPYFLYNSLTAIAALCEQSPAEAQHAIFAFAEYLRTNMRALNAKSAVPFETELKHIETYLYLEQLRFGDELLVDMDIETVDFSLPAHSALSGKCGKMGCGTGGGRRSGKTHHSQDAIGCGDHRFR